jgi:O-acetyl-ADP-ribose deacetylase (regulator of RNase III)
MTSVQYVEGDATAPTGSGPKIIVHVCNDAGSWGAGFVLALSKRWPQPEQSFRDWAAKGEDGGFALGAVQLVQVGPELWVANLVGQHGLRKTKEGPPIRYPAVEKGLEQLAATARQLKASVHMPRIGCGLAGGKWEEMEPIIQRTLCAQDIAVTVYDLPR